MRNLLNFPIDVMVMVRRKGSTCILWGMVVLGLFLTIGPFPPIVMADSPKKISSHRPMQSISPQRFHRELVSYLKRQVASPKIHIKTRLLSPTKPVLVPAGKASLHVVPGPLGGRTGRRAFRVGIHIDNRLTKTVNVIEDIQAESAVILPVRWIKAKDIIKRGDVITQKRSLSSLQQDVIFHSDDAVGKKALRALSPNQPIQQSHLAFPSIIKKGDRVIIEARQGGLVVQTVGIAKASGEKGKTIPVENQQSHREVLGRIVDPGLVEVRF